MILFRFTKGTTKYKKKPIQSKNCIQILRLYLSVKLSRRLHSVFRVLRKKVAAFWQDYNTCDVVSKALQELKISNFQENLCTSSGVKVGALFSEQESKVETFREQQLTGLELTRILLQIQEGKRKTWNTSRRVWGHSKRSRSAQLVLRLSDCTINKTNLICCHRHASNISYGFGANFTNQCITKFFSKLITFI